MDDNGTEYWPRRAWREAKGNVVRLTYDVTTIVIIALMVALCLIMMFGCTCSVTIVHTEGQATDIVDDSDSNTPTASAVIPMVPWGK